MGVYSEGLGRYLERNDLTLKTSGAETTSTTHSAVEVGDAAVLNLEVVVTAVSGTTPTMLIAIEGSHDNSNWYTIAEIGEGDYTLGSMGTPTNIDAAGTYRATVPATRYVRSKSTIAGTTPSFTYSIGGSSA